MKYYCQGLVFSTYKRANNSSFINRDERILTTSCNLVPRVLSYPPYGARERARGESPENEVGQADHE